VGFKQLSAATSLEPETLRKWEVGETYDVPFRGVILYARQVGITLDELVEAAGLSNDAEPQTAQRAPDDAMPELAKGASDLAASREVARRRSRSSRPGRPRA
jgi:hypothetical protein